MMKHNQLIALYNQTSKHSNYQILAAPLRELIPTGSLQTRSRYEQERLNFILGRISVADVVFADIGGDTGFFTFELLDQGARSALFFEGNQIHSKFVAEATTVLGWQKRITVYPIYFDFDQNLSLLDVDVCLLLNVLHHVGDDYGDSVRSVARAKQNILDSLNRLSFRVSTLVFQVGFNWMGDRNRPLFQHGTKTELIEFIKSGTTNDWNVHSIGIAERSRDGGIIYQEVNAKNIQRDDSLGEFLNRPLFILRSKHRAI